MSSLTFEKKNSKKQDRQLKNVMPDWVFAAIAFVFGLVPCLLHNLIFCESRIMLSSDGKHFLHTVALLVEYLRDFAGGPQAAAFLASSDLASHIIFDGPLISLIYAPIFLLLGKIPDPRDCLLLSYGHSCFHALSTAFLTLIAIRLTGSRILGLTAALAYALYPPAVLQSGHFMSEIPVVALLTVIFYCLSKSSPSFFSFLLAGCLASLVFLTKPALIPCLVLLTLFGLLKLGASALNSGAGPIGTAQKTGHTGHTGAGDASEADLELSEPQGKFAQKTKMQIPFAAVIDFLSRRRLQISGLICGIILVMIPWMVFSFNTTKSIFPTAQRQPLFNVVTGWNYEAGAWAHNPTPQLTAIFTEADGPFAAAAGIWQSHPLESIGLAFSKLSRLSSCPWNDFKGRSLGLDENSQILVHRLLIACGIFGAAIFLFCRKRYLKQEQSKILQMAILISASHLAYLMVECQPRYAFTAMPFVCLLAFYGLWQVSCLSFHDPIRRFVILSSVAIALTTTAFLLHAENICRELDPGSLKEARHQLGLNDSVEKIIDLSAIRSPKKIKSLLLLVDGDKNLSKAKLFVNGVASRSPLVSTMHFDAAHYALFDQLREFGPAMRISVDDFRQWRAISIEPSLINWQGRNRFVLKNPLRNCVVYGDKRKNRFVLSPDFCNYGLLAASPLAAGAETRMKDPVLAAEVNEESFLTNKLEGKNKLKDSLRIRLLVELDNADAGTAQNLPPSRIQVSSANPRQNPCQGISKLETEPWQRRLLEVKRQSFDPMLWDNNSNDCLRINRVALYAAHSVAATFPFADFVPTDSGASYPKNWQTSPEILQASHWKVRIKGELKALNNPGDIGLLCAVKGENQKVQILGKTPRAITASKNWRRFQIDDIVPLELFADKPESLELALYPCPWMEGQYGVSRRATDALLKNLSIEVYPENLPSLSGRKRIVY